MGSVFNTITKVGIRLSFLAALPLLACQQASASTTISASATDLQVSLSLLGIPAGLTLGTSSGTAGAAFNISNSVASVGQSLNLIGPFFTQGVSAGVMTTAAQSGISGQPAGSANATIANLSLGLNAIGLSALGVNASLISSNTTFDGTNFTGTSSILSLGVGSQLANYVIDTNALLSSAVDNVILSAAGLTITLNEQLASDLTTGGFETKSLTTNALHVSYKDFLFGGGLLNGDVIVGQSKVSATAAVPEAATWAMMIVGFGMVGGMLRSQRTKPVQAIL